MSIPKTSAGSGNIYLGSNLIAEGGCGGNVYEFDFRSGNRPTGIQGGTMGADNIYSTGNIYYKINEKSLSGYKLVYEAIFDMDIRTRGGPYIAFGNNQQAPLDGSKNIFYMYWQTYNSSAYRWQSNVGVCDIVVFPVSGSSSSPSSTGIHYMKLTYDADTGEGSYELRYNNDQGSIIDQGSFTQTCSNIIDSGEKYIYFGGHNNHNIYMYYLKLTLTK